MNDRNIKRGKLIIEYDSIIFASIVILSEFLFNNSIYLILGSLLYALIIFKIQIPYKPSIFSLLFTFHFIQIISGVLLSNYLGKDINFRSEYLDRATLISYLGLLILFVPLIYYQKKIPESSFTQIKYFSDKIYTKRVLELYIAFFFFSNTLGLFAFNYQGLTQIIISLKNRLN